MTNQKCPRVDSIEQWSQADLGLNLIPLLTSCVASGKFLNLSEHDFPFCKNSDDADCLGLLRESNGKVPESMSRALFTSTPFVPPDPQLVLRGSEWGSCSSLLCFRPNSAHRGKLRPSLTRPTLSRPLVYRDYLRALG